MLPNEYPLFRSTTAALRGILALVVRGYGMHHYGAVDPARVLPLVEKLDAAHHVLLHPNHQAALKKVGHPTARLVLAPRPHPAPEGERWPFVLLASGPLKGERLYQVDDPRHPLVWRGIYQLYRTEWERWSWRMEPGHWAELAAQVGRAVEGHPEALVRRLEGLTRYPRFHGVHQDVRRLVYLARKSWGSTRRGHRHRSGMAQPDWAKYLGLRPLRGIGGKLYADPPLTLGGWLEGARDALGGTPDPADELAEERLEVG